MHLVDIGSINYFFLSHHQLSNHIHAQLLDLSFSDLLKILQS